MIPATRHDRSRHPGQSPLRVPFDFYATPPEATRALLSVEDFDGLVWEPACGHGAISRVLVNAGYSVVSTDLIDRGYGSAPRRRETPVEEDSTRIIVDRSGS